MRALACVTVYPENFIIHTFKVDREFWKAEIMPFN